MRPPRRARRVAATLVAQLLVARPDIAQRELVALTWTDAPATLRRDVVTGTLAGLWSDRGVSTATCRADDISGTTLDDVRRIGANDRGLDYLVRSQDACGLSGTHGFDSLGTERLAPSACR